MRAIFILLMSIILILTGCASIEIAKEVTKVTKRIETSIKKRMDPKKEDQEQVIPEEDLKSVVSIKKKQIAQDKQKISEIVLKQKKVATLNLMGNTFNELNQLIGQPQLLRKDRQTMTARYDSKNCRIFVFMNAASKKQQIEYYELRNVIGELIDHQKDIEKCFEEIKPI